jgi:hypothetical protein
MPRTHTARMTSTARKPGKNILDPVFRYRPSHATDIRETFERVRRELEHSRGRQAAPVNVVRLKATSRTPN